MRQSLPFRVCGPNLSVWSVSKPLRSARPSSPSIPGGFSEWLTDGVNGRLVPPSRGSAGLGEVIAALLKDAADWRQLSASARQVSRQFTILAHVNALEDVFAGAAREAAVVARVASA
jgi:glycosyltransferase involved in cell wall biosynthesis